MGLGAAAAMTVSCLRKSDKSGAPTPALHNSGPMTMRSNHNTGDKVSLLGYGCMRLPVTEISETENEIDQEEVNRLTDYALEHGVNYFDTAPVYCQGRSEKAMGIALSRHPRDK